MTIEVVVVNAEVYLRPEAVVTKGCEVITDDMSRLLVVTRGVVSFEVVWKGVVSVYGKVVVSESLPAIYYSA